MSKAKMKSAYIHTIDGKPAYFSQGQIGYCYDGMPLEKMLVDSLATIRRQQKANADYRNEKGWAGVGRYDYIRIRVPADFEFLKHPTP